MKAYRVTIKNNHVKSIIEVLATNPCEAIQIVLNSTQISPPRMIKAEPA